LLRIGTLYQIALVAGFWFVTLGPVAGQSSSAISSATIKTTATAEETFEFKKPDGATKAYALEVVTETNDFIPRGIAVSSDKRVFLCFPRDEDNSPYTLGELKAGSVIAYPDAEINKNDGGDPATHLVSVVNANVDSQDHLWLLDSGLVKGKIVKDAPKLVEIDTKTAQILRNIPLANDVVLPTTSLEDLVIDHAVGKQGIAIIADSSNAGPSALIVVDLASGKSIRRLSGQPSVSPDFAFDVFAEGRMVRIRVSANNFKDWRAGVSGLAISADGKTLTYSPMASRNLYSLSVEKLSDPKITDSDLERSVQDLGQPMGTPDGLESDSENRIYLTDVQYDAIRRRNADGSVDTLVSDKRLSWPDRLYLAADGYLYVTCSQYHRSPIFNYGKDLRQKPYQVFRIKVDAQPAQP
jgi:sugar lactone lactonase YvrE